MICSNCNKEIREGATYCEECGAPIDEPIVLKEIKLPEKTTKKESKSKEKEKLAATGPLFDFGGYVKGLGSSTYAILALVGGLVTYLAPFMTWMWLRLKNNKMTGNLFEIGGKNHEMSLQNNWILLIAILMMLVALCMIVMSAASYIRPLKPIHNNFIIKLAILLVAVVAFILIMSNDSYKVALDSIQQQIETAELFNYASDVDGGRGIGPTVYICGVVVYGASVVLEWFEEKR